MGHLYFVGLFILCVIIFFGKIYFSFSSALKRKENEELEISTEEYCREKRFPIEKKIAWFVFGVWCLVFGVWFFAVNQ